MKKNTMVLIVSVAIFLFSNDFASANSVDVTYSSNIEMSKTLWILFSGAVLLTFLLAGLFCKRHKQANRKK